MGKFFPSSHLPGPQQPRLGSTRNFPLPAHLLCLGLCPFFRDPPLGAPTSAPTRCVAFFSPTAPANSLPWCWAGRSWPSAHSGCGGARSPAGGGGAHPDPEGPEPPLPRRRGPLGAQARATPLQVGDRTRPLLATFPPNSPQGRRRGLRAVLVEREAAERRLDPARGAIRGLGLHRGLDPGKPQLRAGDSHLSSPLAPAPRAGSPAPTPLLAPPRFAPPRPCFAPPPTPDPDPPARPSQTLRLRGWGPHPRSPLAMSPRRADPLANERQVWAEQPWWRPAPCSSAAALHWAKERDGRLQATWWCFHCQRLRSGSREERRLRPDLVATFRHLPWGCG